MKDDGGPAFPRTLPTGYVKANDADEEFWERQRNGMSLRAYFAAEAMSGILASYSKSMDHLPEAWLVATKSIAYADSLIRALEGKGLGEL